MRIDSQGTLLPPVNLSYNPVQVATSIDGRVYALTRIPLSSPGLMYGVNPDGSILWSNFEGPSNYNLVYARRLCVTSTGNLWMGDVTALHGQFWAKPLLLRIDRDSGAVLQTLYLPDLSGQTGDEAIPQMVGDIDGTFWVMHLGAPDAKARLVHTDGTNILQSIVIEGGGNGFSYDLRLDGMNRFYVQSIWDQDADPPEYATKIYRYDLANPEAMDESFDLGGMVDGHALGATGEALYVAVRVLDGPGPPFPRRLIRLNVVSKVQSSVPLSPEWVDTTLADGDPTGFIYANVVDRMGDNDGDGAPNGAETAAGSNPFDATSRPSGPKVYISFAQSNGALILKYVDPDGILNPTAGLNLASLSVTSSQHGQIFQYLLSFLTFVQVSPDQTEVTALFGALPIPPDVKWQFEATVADKTGATGWDWQVSRPGDL